MVDVILLFRKLLCNRSKFFFWLLKRLVQPRCDFKFVVFILQCFDLLVELCDFHAVLFYFFIDFGYPFLVLLIQRLIVFLKGVNLLLQVGSLWLHEFNLRLQLFDDLVLLIHLFFIFELAIWSEEGVTEIGRQVLEHGHLTTVFC